MKIAATIHSEPNRHATIVSTNGTEQALAIAPKPGGRGSSVNGGELLLLALATCFCNDLYREAATMNIAVSGVDVRVTGEFGGVGQPGFNFQYTARVTADAPPEAVQKLIEHTDRVAEVHNTLRKGLSITLQP